MDLLKKKYLIIISFWTISFLLIIFLIVLPLITSIQSHAASIRREQNELLLLTAENQNIQNFKDRYQNQENVQKIKDFFAEPEVPIAFIVFLEEAAREAEITLEISPLPQGEKGIRVLRFFLRGKGSFLGFYNFLARLEEIPFLVDIETLDVRKEKRPGEQVFNEDTKIEFSLSINVYARSQ
jgi:hypothetical protein